MCGVTSRRKADDLIREGRVRVNGQEVREVGVRIDPEVDTVEVDGREVSLPELRYIMLNKPPGCLTQLGRGSGRRRTVEELIKDVGVRVFPVGRLDYNTRGLLILTNDGELANRILHPRYKLPKVYRALVEGRIGKNKLRNLRRGADLEDGFAKPDDVRILAYRGKNTVVEITFHEGRKHIVKRYMARMGHRVLELERIAVGPLRLGNLPEGRWRDLTSEEVMRLKRSVGLK